MSNDVYERSSRLIRNLSNLRKRGLKKIQASAGFEPVTSANTGAVLYQLSYEAITVGSRSNFSGSIMPLRVIQHYSDWVCTAVMSNDVMKDLRG